eukprot:Nk52_evm7s621 gene=Nk52_evmTU7s621
MNLKVLGLSGPPVARASWLRKSFGFGRVGVCKAKTSPAICGSVFCGRKYSSVASNTPVQAPDMVPGFVFDIDGVLIRGSLILPEAKEAFRRLVYPDGTPKVPFVFVTNGGGTTEQKKASQLSKWLEVPVHPRQVVLSHSPMAMMTEYFNKHCLLLGQGDLKTIAGNYGFTNTVTFEEFCESYPLLDVTAHGQREFRKNAKTKGMEKIEAIFTLSDPVQWEGCLQVAIDLLRSNGVPGMPYEKEQVVPYFSSNADFLWMAEHNEPRFGQGAFTMCLNTLFEGMTGSPLNYTQFGKPYPITYEYSEALLQNEASRLGFKGLTTVYGIGDNPKSDIRGANGQDNMKSVLVRTGVFDGVTNDPVDPADYVVEDVLESVELVSRLHKIDLQPL